MSRAPVDLIRTGDHQPAERRFGLSHRMLEVCLELGSPVSVKQSSPPVLRDLGLLREINEWAVGLVGARESWYNPAETGESVNRRGALARGWEAKSDVNRRGP